MIDHDGESESTLKMGYSNDPSDGAFRAEELRCGEQILTRCGLLEVDGRVKKLMPEALKMVLLPEDEAIPLLLRRLLRREQPPWLTVAVNRIVQWEYVPDDAAGRLAELITDSDERDRLMLAAARRFDADALRALGAEGERYVVNWCRKQLRARGREELAKRVVHVSQLSDQLGYDVFTPDFADGDLHLEVKTQGGQRNPLRVFLSRNEVERAKRDPRWVLVLCERRRGGKIHLRGWCRYESFRVALPRDACNGEGGRWVSAELLIARNMLRVGIPLDPDED